VQISASEAVNPRYHISLCTLNAPKYVMTRPDYPRNTLRAGVLFLTTCLLAGGAQAEWLALGRSETFRVYMDQKSLQRNGERVQVFQLMDFVTAQWADERTVVGSIKSLVEYDCSQPRSRTVALEAYSEQMGDGRTVANEQLPNAEWENINPGSTSEKIRQMVCTK